MTALRFTLAALLLISAAPVWSADAPATADNANPDLALLKEGAEVMKAGDPRRAITDYFDPVIARFEAEYKDSKKKVFSARTQSEAILYAAFGAAAKTDAVVLDSTWADAYLLKAYALTELGELQNARAALESAIALSPNNAQYMSELAYTYIAEKNWDKALEIYQQSADAADAWSDESTKNEDLGRAWRGQGYALTELGKLDEAEALYQKCLKLNPHDDKARGELRYIAGLRNKKE